MKCPTHHRELVAEKTDYGLRWQCPWPGCTVACWNGSTSTPADAETRALRHRVHQVFDPLWQGGNAPYKLVRERGPVKLFKGRNAAYRWLREAMGLDKAHAHIGMFDAEQCRQALACCERKAEQGVDTR